MMYFAAAKDSSILLSAGLSHLGAWVSTQLMRARAHRVSVCITSFDEDEIPFTMS